MASPPHSPLQRLLFASKRGASSINAKCDSYVGAYSKVAWLLMTQLGTVKSMCCDKIVYEFIEPYRLKHVNAEH
jgi:hypothetical protein